MAVYYARHDNRAPTHAQWRLEVAAWPTWKSVFSHVRTMKCLSISRKSSFSFFYFTSCIRICRGKISFLFYFDTFFFYFEIKTSFNLEIGDEINSRDRRLRSFFLEFNIVKLGITIIRFWKINLRKDKYDLVRKIFIVILLGSIIKISLHKVIYRIKLRTKLESLENSIIRSFQISRISDIKSISYPFPWTKCNLKYQEGKILQRWYLFILASIPSSGEKKKKKLRGYKEKYTICCRMLNHEKSSIWKYYRY